MPKRRTALRPEFILGMFVSVLAHGLLLGAKPFYRPAEAHIDSGATAIELTLMPSIASTAAAPEPVQPVPQTEPPEPVELHPEPIQASEPQSTEPEIPEPEIIDPPEPAEAPAEPAKTERVDAIAQDGSVEEDKGAVTEAAVQSACRPVYPGMSRRRNEEGIVVLSVDVDAAGVGSNIQIVQSSGHRRLDKAAVKALKKARFSPATRFGKPVASTLTRTFNFQLSDE